MGRRKPTIPTREQEMIIRKSGYEPADHLVWWDNGEYLMIVRRDGGKGIKIEK